MTSTEATVPTVKAQEGSYQSLSSWGKIAHAIASDFLCLWPISVLRLLHQHRHPVPPRQLVPWALARIGVSERRIQEIQESTQKLIGVESLADAGIRVVALTYPWLSREHPDPEGYHLDRVVEALDAHSWASPGHEDSVFFFWDFMSFFRRGSFYANTYDSSYVNEYLTVLGMSGAREIPEAPVARDSDTNEIYLQEDPQSEDVLRCLSCTRSSAKELTRDPSLEIFGFVRMRCRFCGVGADASYSGGLFKLPPVCVDEKRRMLYSFVFPHSHLEPFPPFLPDFLPDRDSQQAGNPGRTPERGAFGISLKALLGIDLLYASPNTLVFCSDGVPQSAQNQRPYSERGWCSFEDAASTFAPPQQYQLLHRPQSLAHLSAPGMGGEAQEPRTAGDGPRVPPSKAVFDDMLSTKCFVSGADRENVSSLYHWLHGGAHAPYRSVQDLELNCLADADMDSLVAWLHQMKQLPPPVDDYWSHADVSQGLMSKARELRFWGGATTEAGLDRLKTLLGETGILRLRRVVREDHF
uniref:Uncharacterized protein n=1 Tax=Chromera velia CCMP2878 TaxID=1169474 RepID=A0A0G4G2S3_9ALVE|eukprot:Cvel_19848.t1-p1 / transcript=Cvel_19848.t1 / gene=Cvel_19848 / organism=Chromera_velia_CCMP2878 / gene_product=hypothetical protein / transcript_product=hypothetical protein / location=Cvel_scaffold1738:12847-14418(-) / protein_length=524 / sequence_SO=supercontig / SO=protein_coding / is_pseudo=false